MSAQLSGGATFANQEVALGRLCHSDPLKWFGVWGTEVLPRTAIAGNVIGLILTNSTMPQVVRTSDGKMPKLTRPLWIRMCVRITPIAGALKTAQYAVMREMKLTLDQVCHPGLSTMLSFGVVGTLFQSVIYNTLIAEMYKVYTGQVKQKPSLIDLARGVQPGIVWCFGRECFSMGGGLYLGPFVKARLAAAICDESGAHRVGGVEIPEGVLRFSSGFLSGACTALATQWMHNVSLMAGRLAATGEVKGAPYYTAAAYSTAYKELGVSLFYLNYPHRMCLIAGAVALLNMVDIFHKPELRML
eukprot:TRINITY_DN22382_c0_g1_i1.p1 TRINITY_DN22382_c0_g1~~TRINITY_DN22382_c0_g1_i1.p1  ORF type:complete len:316 (-),score=35.76 TRINITY_DN22382_c0_g1_i1:149-1054(-)